ncbi:MAG: SCO family protein [Rickettsiales bacterium]|nr:SCO family protein [Rickettsiales bacterium]
MRTLAILMVVVIVGIFAMLYLGTSDFLTPNNTKYSGKALIGGDFSLTDHHGKPFTNKDLEGKYSLVYFGFTYCPDICPTSLLVVSNALEQIGDLAEQFQPVFITVDPERDTVETLKLYVSNFHSSFIGLTGTTKQVKVAANAYKVYFAKVEQKDSALGYMVDHSGYLFLMNKKGEYLTHFPHNVAEKTLADTLKRTIQSGD